MPPTKQKTIPKILEIHSDAFQFLSKRLESFKIHGWVHKNHKSTPQTVLIISHCIFNNTTTLIDVTSRFLPS